MRRIHVGLYFENVPGKLLVCWFNNTVGTAARLRLRCELQEVLKERLNAEIVNRTAEKYWSKLASFYFLKIKRITGHVKQLQILTQLIMEEFSRHLAYNRIFIALNLFELDRGVIIPLEQLYLVIHAVVHAA
ncbi:hypothetical protein D3C73_1037290 [compost metagenome]